MKTTILILVFSFLSFFGFSQNIGVGASGVYNIQTESIGFGGRVNFFPNNTISIVPQITYYPGFSKITEYLVGLGVEYKIIRGNTFNYYLMAHGGYNNWTNADSSPMEGAQVGNWNLEGGIGITTNRCLRPFLEYRYNSKFLESHLQLGILFLFNCKGSGNNAGNSKYPCPAFN